jgi:hypothetical protein
MLTPTLAVAMLAAAVPSLALASPSFHVDRSASLRSLVLHRNDLPASFGTSIVESGLPIDNQNAAVYLHTSVATLSQHGRTTGYQSSLGSRDPAHYFALLDTVDRYRSAAGAHWQWQRDKSLHPAPPSAHRLDTSGVGDEAWGFSAFGARGGTAGVYFRRGHYWARVYILTFSSLSAGDILRLARTIDGRLKHAG